MRVRRLFRSDRRVPRRGDAQDGSLEAKCKPVVIGTATAGVMVSIARGLRLMEVLPTVDRMPFGYAQDRL